MATNTPGWRPRPTGNPAQDEANRIIFDYFDQMGTILAQTHATASAAAAALNLPAGGPGLGALTDNVVPSAPTLDMSTSGGGYWTAVLGDPTLGFNSIFDTAEDYSLTDDPTHATWVSVPGGPFTFGSRLSYIKSAPQIIDLAYYFRFAYRNRSDQPSDPNGPGPTLGQNGWGPWVYTAVAVHSGAYTPNAFSKLFFISAGTFTDHDIFPGNVGWTGVKVNYNGVEYLIADDIVNLQYVYWRLASPTVFQTSSSPPTLGPDDFIIGENISGVFYQEWASGGKTPYTVFTNNMRGMVAGTMQIIGRKDVGNNQLISTADGTELGNSTKISLIHGPDGEVEFSVNNTLVGLIDKLGLFLSGHYVEMSNVASEPSAPGAGAIAYAYGDVLKGIVKSGTAKTLLGATGIPPASLAGYPSDVTKFLAGDGTWIAAGGAVSTQYESGEQVVTSDATLGVKGTAVTIIASTSFDAKELLVVINYPQLIDDLFHFDLLVDSSVLIPDFLFVGSSKDYQTELYHFTPSIAAGSDIKLQCANMTHSAARDLTCSITIGG